MLERRHIESAEQIVAALGTMKGAAMKLGQALSFLDVGLVPESHREEFQAKLAAAGHGAEGRFDEMRKLIETDSAIRSTTRSPISTRSRSPRPRSARLPRGLDDGRDVAVKVQYPGVAQAMRADMENLGMFLRLLERIPPGSASARRRRSREQHGEELDYEHEAQNQRGLARVFRDTRSSRFPTSRR